MKAGFSFVDIFQISGKIGADGNIANLSKYQKKVIHYLAINGPIDVYTMHKITKISQSTIQVSMKRLLELHLVSLSNKGESEKSGVKNTYSLTLPGILVTIDLLLYEKNEYPSSDFEKTIDNWRELCPGIFDKWDFLISHKDCNCPDSHPFGIISLNTPEENYWVPTLLESAQSLYCGFEKVAKTDDMFQKEFQETLDRGLSRRIPFLIGRENVDNESLNYCLCLFRKDKKIWADILGSIQREVKYHREEVKKLTDMKARMEKMYAP